MFCLQVNPKVRHPAGHFAAQWARGDPHVTLAVLDHGVTLGVGAAAYVTDVLLTHPRVTCGRRESLFEAGRTETAGQLG